MLTFEIFFAFWQKVSPDLAFPEMQAGDEASYVEWTGERGIKHQGTRKAGARHGIIRTIGNDGLWIEEATFYEDKRHGLAFVWRGENYTNAFTSIIYDHGERKAVIWWNADWSEYRSAGDKELILMNNGLNIFKP